MGNRRIVDARGSFCPGPLMELIAAMKMAGVGAELEVLSSDKGSANDIPEWIRKAKHEMVDTREDNGVWHIVVRKAK
jgi:tRNA 2-thiouridine synthesizing protein A